MPEHAGVCPVQAGARIVVLSPNWLGDAIMALPAVADLRRHASGASLAVAARRGLADLWRAVPGVDAVVPLDYDGRLAHAVRWRSDTRALAAGGFTLAVVLPNSFASAWLVSRAGIPERWGFRADIRAPLLTWTAPKPRALVHQAEYYQTLVRAFGIETGPLRPVVHVPGQGRAVAVQLLGEAGVEPGTPFVTLAPGAAYGKAKQWLPERFAELVADLAREGLASVVVGSHGDREATAQIAQVLAARGGAARAVDLVGRTDLPALMGVMATGRACVSNDSGAMHLAAAIGVPVTAIFGSTNERGTAPLPAVGDRDDPRRVAVISTPVWCRPCMLRECPIDHRCMTGVRASAVAAAVKRQVSA